MFSDISIIINNNNRNIYSINLLIINEKNGPRLNVIKWKKLNYKLKNIANNNKLIYIMIHINDYYNMISKIKFIL